VAVLHFMSFAMSFKGLESVTNKYSSRLIQGLCKHSLFVFAERNICNIQISHPCNFCAPSYLPFYKSLSVLSVIPVAQPLYLQPKLPSEFLQPHPISLSRNQLLLYIFLQTIQATPTWHSHGLHHSQLQVPWSINVEPPLHVTRPEFQVPVFQLTFQTHLLPRIREELKTPFQGVEKLHVMLGRQPYLISW